MPDGQIERLALDELHRVVMHAPIAAAGKDGHDVRVVQLRRRLGLVIEAGHLLAVQDRGKGQHFQRHAAVQRYLPGFVDDAHAAAADLAQDRVIAQLPLPPSPVSGRAAATGRMGAVAWKTKSRLAKWARIGPARSGCRATSSSAFGERPSSKSFR